MRPLVEVRRPGADRPGMVEHLDSRLHQLPAHDAGDRAADHSRDDGEDQIERADVLMVRRHEPADEEARLVVRVMMRVMLLEVECVGGGAHLGRPILETILRLRRTAGLRKEGPREQGDRLSGRQCLSRHWAHLCGSAWIMKSAILRRPATPSFRGDRCSRSRSFPDG